MNNEIKEILDYWQFYINEPNNYKLLNIHFDEIKRVLDYITNLQEENERLKKELFSKPDNEITLKTTDGQTMTIIQSERIDMQEKLNKSLEEMYKKYNDYKSRNEKAIEFIEEELTFYITIGGTDERKLIGYNKAFDELLDILKGSDKE